MKLLAPERKYLLKMLEKDAEYLNRPMGNIMADWYASPCRTEADLKYRDRLENAKKKKAALVASIIAKLNAE